MEGRDRLVNLKLDENLPLSLAPRLARYGHDVDTVDGEALLGQPDPVIVAAASREGRVLLTLDVGLADLTRYPPGTHPGIILFRPRGIGPRTVSAFIESFVRDTDLGELVGCVVVVEPGRTRVRAPE